MMKKTRKVLTFLLAALCVVGTAGVVSACQGGGCSSGSQDESLKISFKDNFPTHLSLNVSVDISQYVEYEKGQSLTMTAEYTDANGVKKSYETFGTSFMPTELGEVTITITLKGTNISLRKTVPVKVSAPKVLSSETVIRFRGEEFAVDGLKEGLNVLAPNNEYTFKALKATLLGGDEVVDLSGLTTYVFANAGMYEVKYEVYNDGGSTEGTLLVFSKRILTENEKEDLSNYGEGVVAQASGKVVVDEEDKAENSDWSYAIWADSSATGVDVFDYAPTYWTNYGMLELEGGIDLSRYYLEFDVKFSKDSRELFAIRMVDETQTTASAEKIVSREGEADENGEYAWQHVSMKDMYKYGTYQYLRIVVMHPLTSDSSSYDVNNVFVKIDNVKLCEYDVPYEYHEAVNYVKTEADYTAQEGEFEEEVTLWENMDDSSRPTYLAQDGVYTNEVTEFNFTIDDAGIDKYRFVLGARVSDAGSYNDGVYLDFRRDASAAFFAVYAPEGLKSGNNVDAQHCYFKSGHNYTATFGVIDNTISLWIYDNTSNQIALEYEYLLDGVTIPENGGFGFWSYENINVACKKPHIYVKPQDAAEVTITQLSLGELNSATAFEVMIGNGTLQQVFISETNNLSSADGTFGTTSTWNDRKFYGQVGVIGFTRTAFYFFPTGTPAPQLGDKITVSEGATIIVEGYTVIFGEAFEVWYNGETWQTEYVEAPQQPDEPDEPEDPNAVTMITLGEIDARSVYTDGMYQLYFTMDITQTGATWGGWDNNAKVMFNDAETKADGWCFASSKLLYVQLTTADEANPLTIVKGTALTINGKKYEIANDYNVYYYDGTWQTEAKPEPQEVTLSDYSFGMINNVERVDIVFGNGTLQKAIAGCTNNLTNAEGTFGTSSTWNEDAFPSRVGVLPNGANGLMIFPSYRTAESGDKLTVPAGATIIIDGYTAIFGETLELWFNGATWQMEEVTAAPTTVLVTTLTYESSGAEYKTLNFTSENGATEYVWGKTTVEYNGVETQMNIVWENATTLQIGTGKDWAEGDVFTIKAGKTFVQAGTIYEFANDYSLYYYDGAWHTEELEVPENPVDPEDPNKVTMITIKGLKQDSTVYANGMYQIYLNMDITQNGATWGGWDNSASVSLNGADKVADGWCFATDKVLYVQVTTTEIANPIILKAGTRLTINDKQYQIAEDFNIYYYAGAFHNEPQANAVYISDFTLGTNNNNNQIDIVIGKGALPESFASAGDLRADTAFTAAAQWNDQSFSGKVGVLGNGNTFNFFPPSGQAKLGDKITVPQGTTITIGKDIVTFGEKLELWFNGTSWQMTEPVVLTDFTFGAKNGAGYFDIVPTSAEIPSAIVSSGANLSTAGGTFGKSSTWTRDSGATTVKFPGQVGVLASAAQNFQIFPSGANAQAGDVITIPEGATIIVNGYSVVFGKTITVTFNGTTWEGLKNQEVKTTPMTLVSIDETRTIYDTTNGWYGIYLKTDINNTGKTWGGWDNKTNVSLNGTATRADWCFANTGANSLLYIQITTTETANPITIAKGTQVTINEIIYEITEDFHIYYYDGAFHTEPQA